MSLKKKSLFNLYYCFLFLLIAMNSFSVKGDTIDLQKEILKKYLFNTPPVTEIEAKTLLIGLKGHPLERYAQHRFILDSLDTVEVSEVIDFINAEPISAVNESLIAEFIEKKADKEDWNSIETLSRGIELNHYALSPKNRCQIITSQLKKGKAVEINTLSDIWLTGANLPDACDFVNKSYLSLVDKDSALSQRVVLAIKADNLNLARYLVKQFSKAKQDKEQTVLMWLNNPKEITPFLEYEPTQMSQEIAVFAFSKSAKEDLILATTQQAFLANRQKLSLMAIEELNDVLLKQLLFLDKPNASEHKLRELLFQNTNNDELIAYRMRIALRENDWDTLKLGLDKLSYEAKQDDAWLYWQSRVLMKENKKQEAQQILLTLSKRRGFYPMVAAQALNIPFEITTPNLVAGSLSAQDKLIAQRVTHFMDLGLIGQARREWRHGLKHTDKAGQLALAQFAVDNEFYELAVSATIIGKLWDHIPLRFPIGYLETFKAEIEGKQVPLSYALAIARQESALIYDVVSPAGAKGLMQVMPATATAVAKKHKIENYSSDKDLLNPPMNIKMGVHYLNDGLMDYNNNRIFTTAAYNAGASRVSFWRNRIEDEVDAIQFIESISFPETRNYVKNVLAFDVYYRHLLDDEGISSFDTFNILTEDEWSMR